MVVDLIEIFDNCGMELVVLLVDFELNIEEFILSDLFDRDIVVIWLLWCCILFKKFDEFVMF